MNRTLVIGQALLLLAVGITSVHGQQTAGNPPVRAVDVPLYVTGQNVITIPFAVDPRITQPVEVHLYVSVDQGTTWRLHARQLPGARQFTFRSPGDGEYWFASRTLDTSAAQPQTDSLRAELRVAVDTQKPQFEFTARPGQLGEVITGWRSFDPTLVPASLRIEYQDGIGNAWKPVATNVRANEAAQSSFHGEIVWKPETQSPTIHIRAEISDRAGNRAVVNRRLLLPRGPDPATVSAPESATGPLARSFAPSEGAVPWPSDNGPGPDTRAPRTFPPSKMDSVHTLASAPPETQPGNHTTSPFPGPTAPGPSPPVTTQEFPLPNESPAPMSDRGDDVSESPTDPRGTPPQDWNSEGAAAVEDSLFPASVRSSHSVLPLGERPHMTNATAFQLEYDIDSVGPEEVAEVQLWATADSGETWRLWGTDEDLESPFDVVVREEGVFGFQVVIVCRNGLSGRRPQAGDLADIWVGVDTTAPSAELTAATYGTGDNIGQLMIRWNATDLAIDSRPVTLLFSEFPEGPWTTIASSLPNSGEFGWRADPQLPVEVFLKLEVRDEAGNIGIDQVSEPIRVDGLAPKGRIRGVKPIRDLDREAFRRPRRG